MEISYDYLLFLNDECAIVNSIGRLSLLDMNWIICTELTIISFRNFIYGFVDLSDNKKGETSVFFVDKQILVIPPANCVCGRVYCFHVVRPSERK